VLKKLIHIWKYSDSQPTEITLGLCNITLTPICLFLEIGFMPIFLPLVIIGGIYQLYAVSKERVCLRVKASFFSLCLFVVTLLLYINSPYGLHDATHYGWVLLAISSGGSLIRLKREQLHRNG